MPRLILHAGSHKTGTTAIQTFAMSHRAALAERGWIYPGLAPFADDGRMPHILFAHAVARQREDLLAPRHARRLPRLWAREAKAAGADVFLSAEPIYRHVLRRKGPRDWLSGRRAYLDRLAKVLAPFDVEPVVVFRRPDDFVRSLYQENVFKEARPRWTSLAAFARGGENAMLRYADNAELLAEAFPKTRVLIYEDLAGGDDLCARFFGALGIDVTGLGEPGRVRTGLTAAQTAAKIVLAEVDDQNRTNAQLLALLRSPAVREALDRHFGAGPFDFWPDPSHPASLLEARADDTERLRRRFLPERANVFPPRPATGPPPVPPVNDALRRALAAAAAKPPARSRAAETVASVVGRARSALRGAS